ACAAAGPGVPWARMFERFTGEAREVVGLAQQEARGLAHDHIGTEHLLLAVAAKPSLPAAAALAALGADEARLRTEVERTFRRGEEAKLAGQIPFTPHAKKALELSLREALRLGHNFIAPVHIVLGIVRVDEGGATRILTALGIDREQVRDA